MISSTKLTNVSNDGRRTDVAYISDISDIPNVSNVSNFADTQSRCDIRRTDLQQQI
jgi:hypothetical protein